MNATQANGPPGAVQMEYRQRTLSDIASTAHAFRLLLLSGALSLTPLASASGPVGGHLDWVFYDALPTEQRALISTQCPGGFIDPWTETDIAPNTLTVESGQQSGSTTGTLTFTDNVVITQAVMRLYGERLDYDTQADEALLVNGGLIRQPDLAITTSGATASTVNPQFQLYDAQYVLHLAQLHGEARTVNRDDNIYRLERTWMTRCAPGRFGWSLHARTMTVNMDTDIASGYHAWLNVGPVPVAYTPYFRLNLNQQRTTGFLTPGYRYQAAYQQHRISTPFYWNIAPNIDNTTTADWLIGGDAEDGAPQTVHLNQQWRYLNRYLYAELEGGIYPGFQDPNDDALSWGYQLNISNYDSALEWTLDYQAASSDQYYPEFQYADYTPTFTNRLTLGFESDRGTLYRVNVEQQTVLSDAAEEDDLTYVEQPGIHIVQPLPAFGDWRLRGLYDWERRFKVEPDYLGITPSDFDPYEGIRLRNRLELSRTDRWNQWTLRQTYTGDHTHYYLPTMSDHPAQNENRWLYDTRTRLSYQWDIGAHQRVTPFAQHEFRPLVDQTQLPQMTGVDLLTDRHWLTPGSEYRFQQNAWTHSALLQQQINLTATRLEKTDTEVIINPSDNAGPQPGPVTLRLGTNFDGIHDFSTTAVWTPAETTSAGFYDRDYPLSLLSTTYRFRSGRSGADLSTTWRPEEREDDEDYFTVAASATLPLTTYFGVIGYANWHQPEASDNLSLQETILGLEYDGCCWHIQLAGQRTVKDDADQSQRPALFDTIQLNLTLKGLGGVDSRALQNRIRDNIPSYQNQLFNTK
ncbi:MAG: LPS-assembly protein LptD [Natronospirillum sp.]